MNKVLALSIGQLSEQAETMRLQGIPVGNFTMGDFYPRSFPIASALQRSIKQASTRLNANYPKVGGEIELKKVIIQDLKERSEGDYLPEQIIVTSGARAAIYLAMQVLLEPGDGVIVSLPGWNLNNFVQLARGRVIPIKTSIKNRFLLQAMHLTDEVLNQASLLYLNIPHNPSGSNYTPKEFQNLTRYLARENQRRKLLKSKPLWILIDGIYNKLSTYSGNLFKESEILLPWIIWVDGISKSLSSPGLRLGWAYGPKAVIQEMTLINGSLGAWAAKPIQHGVARFLAQKKEFNQTISNLNKELSRRRYFLHHLFSPLKDRGFIDYLWPEGGIYFCLDLGLIGQRINTTLDHWLLREVGIILVNFTNFGMPNSTWYRVSLVSTAMREFKSSFTRLKDKILALLGKMD